MPLILSSTQTQLLFQQGNYTQVARLGDPECWEKYAALALVGKTAIAIDYFNHNKSSVETDFYKGVAYWISGDDELAKQTLRNVPLTYAQNLVELIQKDTIQVLAQVPWLRNHFTDWLAGVHKDPKFRVNNISFHPDDLPNTPYADVHQFYLPHQPPDFYICQMVEWHLIPPNLQELPCPIFGQTADYDLHIQAVYPWLQIFDELLVTDETEWQDVSQLVSVPVSTFPKSFCLLKNLPPLELKSREIDLYLSGTVTHPYHPDKARLLSQILRISELNIRVRHGFTSTEEYYDNLANSKACFTYVRHPGATPTRGLEALSLGCALVVQEECVLRLFAGQEEGVVTYRDSKPGDLAKGLIQVSQNWEEYQYRAYRGAQIIREEFSHSKVASQFLRYLTFLAAKPQVSLRRQRGSARRHFQKRTVLEKGWLPSYDFVHSSVLRNIYQENMSKLESYRQEFEVTPAIALDMTREITLFNYHCSINYLFFTGAWVKRVEKIYQDAIATSPQSLVLRFNLFRTQVHFGNPIQVTQAVDCALTIIEQPLTYWKVCPQDDVFPYDLFNTFFNYRTYFDNLVSHFKSNQELWENQSIKLILASLHYYLGLYRQDTRALKTAVMLDSEFAPYQMSYIKQLAREDSDFGQSQEVQDILLYLSQSSTEFISIRQFLQGQISLRGINPETLLNKISSPLCISVEYVEKDSHCFLKPSLAHLANPFKDISFTARIIYHYIKRLERMRLKLSRKVREFANSSNLIVKALSKSMRNNVGNPQHHPHIPQLVGSSQSYNFVHWQAFYYGIPKCLGKTNLELIDLQDYIVVDSKVSVEMKIIIDSSLTSLRKQARKSQVLHELRVLTRAADNMFYQPYELNDREELIDYIRSMLSSKFLWSHSSSLLSQERDCRSIPKSELLAEIRRLEQTKAWKLRTYWCRMKSRFFSKILSHIERNTTI